MQTDFQKQVKEKSKQIPVLIDFYADWCPPCQILKPILEKIADSEKYKNKFELVKIDIDENKETAAQFNVMSVPSVKLFKQGKITNEFVGAKSQEDVEDWLDKSI